jgi:GNAT superfamily N-acetyltransferase
MVQHHHTATAPAPAPGLPASPLPDLAVVDLLPDGEAALQRFFEANPAYFLAVHGEPAQPGEALDELQELPPAGWPYTRMMVFGWQDGSGELAAMANVISDLLAPGVWHLGTFIVATQRHGSGCAQRLLQSLEAWALQSGAQWMRLGVVQGNTRAVAFWRQRGYQQVAERRGVVMGRQINTVRVMAKSLCGQPLDAYRALVPRDGLAPAAVSGPVQDAAPDA